MRNYGFNYLVEKVYLINEDRANVWRTYFPKFGEFYKEVSGKIKKDGGVTSSGHVREKTIEYLMVNLLDIFKYGSNYSEYTKKVCKVAPGQRRESFTDGFNKWMDMGKWSWSPQKEKEYALFTIVEKHGDAILSPEIKNKFLDKNNIIEYLDAPSDQGIKKSIIGDDEVDTPEEIEYILKKGEKNYKNQSDVAKQRLKLFLKNRTEISPEDSQYIKSKPKGFSLDGVEWLDEFQIKELLRKNEKKVEKKSSMGRRIPKTSHAALIANERLKEQTGLSREDRDNIYSQAAPLLAQIRKLNASLKKGEVSLSAKYSPEKEFAENILEELKRIKMLRSGKTKPHDKVEQILATNKQLSDDIMNELVAFVSNKEGTTKEAFSDKTASYGNDIKAFGDYIIKKAKDDVSENMENESNLYDGYEDKVLDKVLDTPEKKEIFKTWYRLSRKEIARRTEIFSKKSGSMMKAQFDKNKKAEKDNQKTDDSSNEIKELVKQLKELKNSDEPDYDEIDRLEQEIATLKSGINESCVMNYFSEQIQKDKLTNNKGEFKDRGFKKPKNYAHWLWVNGH